MFNLITENQLLINPCINSDNTFQTSLFCCNICNSFLIYVTAEIKQNIKGTILVNLRVEIFILNDSISILIVLK